MKRIIVCSDGTMNTAYQTTRGGGQDYDIFKCQRSGKLSGALDSGLNLGVLPGSVRISSGGEDFNRSYNIDWSGKGHT